MKSRKRTEFRVSTRAASSSFQLFSQVPIPCSRNSTRIPPARVFHWLLRALRRSHSGSHRQTRSWPSMWRRAAAQEKNEHYFSPSLRAHFTTSLSPQEKLHGGGIGILACLLSCPGISGVLSRPDGSTSMTFQ